MKQALYDNLKEVENVHWWFRARRVIVHSLISKLGFPKEVSVLEVGCGTGGNLKLLSEFGKVKAFEIETSAMENAAKLGFADVRHGYLPGSNPFKEEKFDLIVAMDVLEHIEDDKASMRDIEAALKPGGYFVATVPALKSMWSLRDEHHHHFRRYEKAELFKLLQEANLEVSDIGFYNSILFPLAFIVRKLSNYKDSDEGIDLKIPSKILNGILYKIMTIEKSMISWLSFPVGLSLYCVAKKKSDEINHRP